jgi:hypothetical protein
MRLPPIAIPMSIGGCVNDRTMAGVEGSKSDSGSVFAIPATLGLALASRNAPSPSKSAPGASNHYNVPKEDKEGR